MTLHPPITPLVKEPAPQVLKQVISTSCVMNLGLLDWSNNADTVQEMWNDFESKLIKVVDNCVPLCEAKMDSFLNKPCPIIKSKLNLRNRLLKILKKDPHLTSDYESKV